MKEREREREPLLTYICFIDWTIRARATFSGRKTLWLLSMNSLRPVIPFCILGLHLNTGHMKQEENLPSFNVRHTPFIFKKRIMNHCDQLPVINKPYTYFIRVHPILSVPIESLPLVLLNLTSWVRNSERSKEGERERERERERGRGFSLCDVSL